MIYGYLWRSQAMGRVQVAGNSVPTRTLAIPRCGKARIDEVACRSDGLASMVRRSPGRSFERSARNQQYAENLRSAGPTEPAEIRHADPVNKESWQTRSILLSQPERPNALPTVPGSPSPIHRLPLHGPTYMRVGMRTGRGEGSKPSNDDASIGTSHHSHADSSTISG
jgi:hypothetical protein